MTPGELGVAVCQALDLDHTNVRQIDMSFRPNEVLCTVVLSRPEDGWVPHLANFKLEPLNTPT